MCDDDDMSTMADENIILFLGYHLHIKQNNKKVNRKMWVHPSVSPRPAEGAFTKILVRPKNMFLILARRIRASSSV